MSSISNVSSRYKKLAFRLDCHEFAVSYGESNDWLVFARANYSANRKGKRQYLNETKKRDLLNRLNKYFEKRVTIPGIRRGEHEEIETLINEEALLLARYLRNEIQEWNPRIAVIEYPNGLSFRRIGQSHVDKP